MNKIKNDILKFWSDLCNWVKKTIQSIYNCLKQAFNYLILDNFKKLFNKIKDIFKKENI